jgi:antitoxin HigA-1
VTRKTLSDLLNRHSGMSPEMALRLMKRPDGARRTHGLQMNWSLWRVRQQASKIKVKKFRHPEPT